MNEETKNENKNEQDEETSETLRQWYTTEKYDYMLLVAGRGDDVVFSALGGKLNIERLGEIKHIALKVLQKRFNEHMQNALADFVEKQKGDKK